jgi:CRISPR/Cas system-associated protein Csm6
VPAYRTKDGRPNGTIFLQTDTHRIQIVASVVAESAKRAIRSEQVQRILASFAANP